jgi:DNA-binding NtrC family response regulator
MNYRILIVDDEPNMRRSLELLLESDGDYKTYSVPSGEEALRFLDSTEVDLVVTDLTMPNGMSGMDLLRKIKDFHQNTQVIMMTAYSTVQSAVEAIKIGAYDYLLKPFNDDDFLNAVKKALEVTELRNENMVLKQLLDDKEKKGVVFVAKSPSMKKINNLVEKAANTATNILITGESGTGKEVIARLVHKIGSPEKNRFFAINCASIPETLLESELFGHEKGAFTGAVKTKKGKFELAPEGTIFLDEIGEMPLPLQAKLLRVIEQKTFERLGGVEQIKFNSRIIAATNKDLPTLIKEGKFRDDLFYRLKVVSIEIPPLRDRRDDLEELIELFMTEKSKNLGQKSKQLSKDAKERLLKYDYPGNIRELANIIESALIVSNTNTIKADELPLLKHEICAEYTNGNHKIDIENGFKHIEDLKIQLEEETIKEAVKIHPNMSNTDLADLLGTTRRVLENRMKSFKISK